MNAAQRLTALLTIALLCAFGQVQAIRIELTEPKVDGGMFLTVSASPLRVAGRVIAEQPIVLLMVGTHKVVAKADGSFVHELVLEAGINRVMIMAADASGAKAYTEFTAVLEVRAATQQLEIVSTPVIDAPAVDPPPPGVQRTTLPAAPAEGTAPQRPAVPGTTASAGTATTLSRDQLFNSGGTQGTGTGGVPAPKGRLFALVVGVSRYRFAKEQDLQYAASDAARFAEVLRGMPCVISDHADIVVLRDGDALRGPIKTSLDQLLSRAGENDLFVFYFSGHGLNDSRGRLCLFGSDAEIDDPHKAWAYGITQTEILEAMSDARCRNKLMLLDACHSGSVAAPAGQDGAGQGNVAILTAAQGDERSYESADHGGGLFTHFVVKGLKGAADADLDQAIALPELSAYVISNTASAARGLGYVQHPVLSAAPGSEVRLCVSAAGTSPAIPAQVPEQQHVPKEVEGEKPRYVSYTVPAGERTLDSVLYANNSTGDRIRFFPVGYGGIGISAVIDGEYFACNGRFPSDMIDFSDAQRPNKISKGIIHLSPSWDQLEIGFSLADGKQVKGRTLYRTNTPPVRALRTGHVYHNPTADQQLEVYAEAYGQVSLSGHLGPYLVNVGGRRSGDVIMLRDNDEAYAANGVAMLDEKGNRIKGWIQFEKDGHVERFDLSTDPTVRDRSLEKVRFFDQSSGQNLNFYGEAYGGVSFNGLIGGEDVYGGARVLGDLLLMEPKPGGATYQRGRMLVFDKGERLVTEFRFPIEDEQGKKIKVVPVIMYRYHP